MSVDSDAPRDAEQSPVRALFLGEMPEAATQPFPFLGNAERVELHALTERVGKALRDQVDPTSLDERNELPESVAATLAQAGLFGITSPAGDGGLGLTSARAEARLIEEVGAFSPALAHLLVAHGALGARALARFAQEPERSVWLRALASGASTAAFAFTEERSGSDASTITTRLTPTATGYVLNGTKRYVTNGRRAGLFVVCARTTQPDAGLNPQITALVVEDGPGVERSPALETLGLRGAGVCDVTFRDVAVPAGHLLGQPTRGHAAAMEILSDARVPLAAVYLGQARELIRLTVDWVGRRRSFGRPIQDFPIIKDKLARMTSDCFALESAVHLTAGLADAGAKDLALESAVCRVAAAESLWRIAQHAMQLAGAAGYTRRLPFERHLRDARAAFVFDATNETLRCFIALGGLRGRGRRLTEEGEREALSLREPLKGLGLIRDFAVRTVRDAVRRTAPLDTHPALAGDAATLQTLVAAFSEAVETTLRTAGAELRERQRTQMRLANAVLDLYGLVACLARTNSVIALHGEAGAQREIDTLAVLTRAARERVLRNVTGLAENDDDVRWRLAARLTADGGYSLDVI